MRALGSIDLLATSSARWMARLKRARFKSAVPRAFWSKLLQVIELLASRTNAMLSRRMGRSQPRAPRPHQLFT